MTKFIMLTEAMSGGDSQPLLLNAAYIVHVQGRLSGKDTHIRMSDFTKYYFVKESAEQIWLMINTDLTKASVIMTAEEHAKIKVL